VEDPDEDSAADDDARVREADEQLLGQEQRLKLEDSALQGELIKVRAVQAEVVRKLKTVQQQRSALSRDEARKTSGTAAAVLLVLPSMLRHCADELAATTGSIGSGLGDSWADEEAGLFSTLLPTAAERGAGGSSHHSDGPQPLAVSPPPPPPSWGPTPGVDATWKVEAEDREKLGKLAGRIEDLRRSFQDVISQADREPGEDSASARSTETSRSQSTAAASLMASLVPATASSWSSSRQIGSSPSPSGDGGSDRGLSRFPAGATGPAAGVATSAEKEELQLLAQQLAQQNESLQRELHAEEISRKLCESQVEVNSSPHQRLHDELAQERRYEQRLAEAVASARALMAGDPSEEERHLQRLRADLADAYTMLAAVLSGQPAAGQVAAQLEEGAALSRLAALQRECEDVEALRSAALHADGTASLPLPMAAAAGTDSRSPGRLSLPESAKALGLANGTPMYARLQDGRQVELTSRVHRQEQEIAELRERIRTLGQRTGGHQGASSPQVVAGTAPAGTSSLPPTAFVPVGSSPGRPSWAGRSATIA